MRNCCRAIYTLMLLLGVLSGSNLLFGATLPAGFTSESIGGTWTDAIGLTFDANGRMFVWEKAGKIWVVENGVRLSTPLLDISDEVGNWRDHGLMSVVLHPNFLSNGYFYLLYVVDFHHVAQYGTPNYNPTADQYFRATIGRVTRYTARSTDGFRTADPNSRLVLLGESITTGLPILDVTHAVGSLAFGTDGTLLISCGDAAGTTGGSPGALNSSAYASQAIADGIITPQEDVGSFRSQMVDSLAGKVLRIDPATGDGVIGNPFFNSAAPRSARARVWALGLRNPFRISVRPGTGSHEREMADPGVIYIGDVGWDNWEELDIAKGPGNFGWPLFEGLEPLPAYQDSMIQDQRATNPLYGSGSCNRPYFMFSELLQQDSTNPSLSFPNPCDVSQQIPNSIPKFRHTRPVLDWGRNANGPARTGIYNSNGSAAVIGVGAAGSPVAGTTFKGNCAIGGVWYTSTNFPAVYTNTYFMADYGEGWVKSIVMDTNDKPTRVQDFIQAQPGITTLATSPKDGSLYYVANGSVVTKVTYIGEGNRAPVAVATVDKQFGTSPLTVQFTGSGSSDPDGQSLAYHWDFGDGSAISTAANPSHTFTTSNGSPKSYAVSLIVTDSSNATAQATVLVSANNTPPNVSITSPVDGSFYAMTSSTTYNLTAAVSDAQTAAGSLSYAWQIFLHHNEHEHPEPVITSASSSTVISPIGCDGNTYYYRIKLTVTDPQGLSASDEVNLYPACDFPEAPDNLVANALSSTRVQLTWADNSDDETGFRIERSQNGGPFLNVGTVGPNVTTFINSDLSVATSYSYRVAAVSAVGQSPYSNIANVTSQSLQPVPSPWTSIDIGTVGQAGDAGFSEGSFIVNGAGADIADPNDAFHFVYRTWTGDGTFIARVTGVENTDTWAKAGLMFRRTLAANSAHALMLMRPLNGVAFQTRVSNGGTSSAKTGAEVASPCWLKIVRAGSHFSGYISLDGTEWILVDEKDITMDSVAYVGLALTSHTSAALNTSTFTNLQITSPMVPTMSLDKRPDGVWELTVSGPVGAKYQSEASTNLTTWTPISTNVNSTGTITISDPNNQNFHLRFYRAVLVP